MQAAIQKLESLREDAVVRSPSGGNPSADSDEPQTEEEWLAKLMRQQEELQRLRSSIQASVTTFHTSRAARVASQPHLTHGPSA